MRSLPFYLALLAPAAAFLLPGLQLPRRTRGRDNQVVQGATAGFRLTYGDANSPYLMGTLI